MTVTLEQLKREAVWRAEFVPPNLDKLAQNLRAAFRLETGDVGTIGDHRHLKGYHRSRAWIQQSNYCTNRSYSVTETTSNRYKGNDNWISGMDIAGSEAQLRMIYTRLRNAMDDGRVPWVRQTILEDDPWHVHLSFDRGHVNDDHTYLFRIITGTVPTGGPMTTISLQVPVLREGAQGLDVSTAQGLLNARGFDVKIDGDFGPYTDKATRAMQKAFKAEHVDGVWGPETWTIALTRKDTR